LNLPDENLPQVRLKRRERFRLMRQHHPQGVAPDGARLILHDPPIKKKAPLRRFFRLCSTELNLPDENLPQHQPQGGRALPGQRFAFLSGLPAPSSSDRIPCALN